MSTNGSAPPTATDAVLVSEDRGILTIRLNRPDDRNAVNAAVSIAVGDALQAAQDDPEVRAVVITGAAGGSDLLLSDQSDIEGSRIDLARFFRLLDQAPGTFAIVTREP